MYKSNVKNSNGEGGIKSQIARMLKLINIVQKIARFSCITKVTREIWPTRVSVDGAFIYPSKGSLLLLQTRRKFAYSKSGAIFIKYN